MGDFWNFDHRAVSIYSRKQNWKIVLAFLALAIVAASLFYSNSIVEKIATEERQKVELWSQAIERKARLVKYTDELFTKLRLEERKKVELWVEAIKRLARTDLSTDFTLLSRIVQDNTTVPVILTDGDKKIIAHRNLDESVLGDTSKMLAEIERMASMYEPIEINYYQDQKNFLYYRDSKLFSELQKTLLDLQKSFISEVVKNSASVPVIYMDQTKSEVIEYGNIDTSIIQDVAKLAQLISDMEEENQPIEVELHAGESNFIYYQDSWMLTQLKYFPYVQVVVVGLFMLIAYLLFSTARKAEQNQVWVGMAKETAHQLGTPLSSLLAWKELASTEIKDPALMEELEKDIQRLETITERFSKIGSKPKLEHVMLDEYIQGATAYLRSRSPKNVQFEVKSEEEDLSALLSRPLFGWVLENLVKNAIDSMEGKGKITVNYGWDKDQVFIDVQDTGKGIPSNKRKTVFEPGYTTKQRGWGLGLSLSRRIVEQYHDGKIFVKNSRPGEGTTFRISLKT